jgi:hypothetical protein
MTSRAERMGSGEGESRAPPREMEGSEGRCEGMVRKILPSSSICGARLRVLLR